MRKLYFLLFPFILSLKLFSQETEEFKPSGKILMDVFFDYYYKIGSDTIMDGNGEYQKTPKDFNSFAFRRIYLGYEYNFSEKFYASIILEGADALKLADNKRAVTIKYAYFEWKDIFPGSKLIVGAQKTPIWETTEKIWGYRSVEKTITDFRKIGSSNDVGVGLQGRIDKNGILGYNILIANGSAQVAETDKYKKFYGTLNLNLLDKKLIFELHGNYEKVSDSSDVTLTKAFVGYEHKYFSIGFEEMLEFVNKGNATTKVLGSSLFAKGNIIKDKLSIFGRIDSYNSDLENKKAGYIELFTLFGID